MALFGTIVALGASALAATAEAAPKPLSKAAKQGLSLAKSGDCVAAAIALERAESEDHRPVTAAALAGCHVALGELVLAHEIYEALAKESAAASWTLEDRISATEAKKKALALEARIPKVLLEIQPKDARLDVRAGGRKVELPFAPIRVSPDEKVEIEVRAEGFATEKLSVVLGEGQKKTLTVVLKPVAAPKNPELPVDPPGAGGPKLPSHWMGVRFRGLVVPQFLMNIVGEGGTSTYWPGVGLTYSERLGTVDIEPSLTFTSYALGTTAFKPHGVPDTEWELLESDLWGATAALDIMYRVALDTSGTVELRIGGGFGIGLAFTGDLYRWQSFPKNGEQGDPATYEKCKGPNDPAGTFRYCNQLDKDANRFGQPDAYWNDGGARPLVYPWLSLPQAAFAFRPTPAIAIDLEVGLTLNGFLTGTGVRFGF